MSDDHEEDGTGRDVEGSRPGDGSSPTPPGEENEGRQEPLGDLADRVERRRSDREGQDPPDDLFEEAGDVEVDREELWRQVGGEEAADQVVETETDGSAARGSDDGDRGEPVERVIEKSRYCQQCEHFSDPPDVHCSHEGTRIAEAVDVEHFRVVNCPVVRDDEELENL